jgi:hypothetical protein
MKKPTIRVTKWLGDIPIEATCSVCIGIIFPAKGSSHRPNREEYQLPCKRNSMRILVPPTRKVVPVNIRWADGVKKWSHE